MLDILYVVTKLFCRIGQSSANWGSHRTDWRS